MTFMYESMTMFFYGYFAILYCKISDLAIRTRSDLFFIFQAFKFSTNVHVQSRLFGVYEFARPCYTDPICLNVQMCTTRKRLYSHSAISEQLLKRQNLYDPSIQTCRRSQSISSDRIYRTMNNRWNKRLLC